jgi:hypothetical protein
MSKRKYKKRSRGPKRKKGDDTILLALIMEEEAKES